MINFPFLLEDLDNAYHNVEPFTFYMFKYKTAWCPNKKDSHDSKSCSYAHHLRDFRRPPELFKYLAEDCDTLIKGIDGTNATKVLNALSVTQQLNDSTTQTNTSAFFAM